MMMRHDGISSFVDDVIVPAACWDESQYNNPDFRKYETAPQIEFGYKQVSTDVYTIEKNPEAVVDQDKFILSEVEPSDSLKRGQGSEFVSEMVENPFTGEEKRTMSKIRIRNDIMYVA